MESKVEVWVDIDEVYDNLSTAEQIDFISKHLDDAYPQDLLNKVKEYWSTQEILDELPYDEITKWVDSNRG